MTANSEDIIVVRPVRDSHGDATSFTEHTLTGCVVAPASSTEQVQVGDQVTSRWDVFVMHGADVLATDRLRRPSDPQPQPSSSIGQRASWQVVGDPAPWRSPFSDWTPGMVVTIERVSG